MGIAQGVSIARVQGVGEDVIPAHKVTDRMVDEIELGVVIGRGGRDIPRERAYEHVFGYTVINDSSARKLAHHDEYDTDLDSRHGYLAWLIGKRLDGYCPVGPWVVHRIALPDVDNLLMTTKINNEVVLEYSTADFVFVVPRVIEFFSRMCTLEPGDLISMGTGHGPAGDDEPEREVRPGDRIEGIIEGIGALRNTVGQPA
jgi:2-keto-4-pentenoate hydratase/2-oxohepta-3-ene-1,7-dioic acid hydratase in catechol pathway